MYPLHYKGLQVSLTLEQYSKESHTPTSAQPLGAHPSVLNQRDVYISISLCLIGESHSLGSRSPVLMHMHVQLNKYSFSLHYTGDSSRVHHLNSLLIGG
jgi:hypothetical protein